MSRSRGGEEDPPQDEVADAKPESGVGLARPGGPAGGGATPEVEENHERPGGDQEGPEDPGKPAEWPAHPSGPDRPHGLWPFAVQRSSTVRTSRCRATSE